jgi:Ca2+/Na+ antiporter
MINIINKFGSVFSLKFIVMLLGVGLVLLLWDRKVLYRKKIKKEHTISIVMGIVYISLGTLLFIVGRFI